MKKINCLHKDAIGKKLFPHTMTQKKITVNFVLEIFSSPPPSPSYKKIMVHTLTVAYTWITKTKL